MLRHANSPIHGGAVQLLLRLVSVLGHKTRVQCMESFEVEIWTTSSRRL